MREVKKIQEEWNKEKAGDLEELNKKIGKKIKLKARGKDKKKEYIKVRARIDKKTEYIIEIEE